MLITLSGYKYAYVFLCLFVDLLDHNRDVLIQVAAVELDQVDQDMEEV